MNLPKPLKETTVRGLLADPAFELMYARDKARAFLKEAGSTEEEIDDIIEEVLGKAAQSYKETVTDRGMTPKAKVGISIIPMPFNK